MRLSLNVNIHVQGKKTGTLHWMDLHTQMQKQTIHLIDSSQIWNYKPEIHTSEWEAVEAHQKVNMSPL